jgi:mono/diheme cytochrome c family protein
MRRVLRWLGYGFGALIGLILVFLVVVYALTEYRARRTHDFQVASFQISGEEAQVARGEHVSKAMAHCQDCHGGDFGGKVFFDEPAIGFVAAPNITPGRGSNVPGYSDTDLKRIFKYGIDPDGHALLLMGWGDKISEEDAEALVAFVRTLDPVDREMKEPSLSPLGRTFLTLGFFGDVYHAETLESTTPWATPPEPGVNAEYGRYLAGLAFCTECHQADLTGGDMGPGVPVAADLTATGRTANWTLEDFVTALRTGVSPDGHHIDEAMPWKYYGNMTDEELEAIWLFLRTETGQDP